MRSPARRVLILLWVPFVVLAGACSSTSSGPSDTRACDNSLAFAMTPVPLSTIVSITPLGALGPPAHTIPTDHGGMYINGTGITLVAPAAARIKAIGRNRYLRSPFRQGQSDYSLDAKLCGSYELRLSHVVTVVDRIAARFKTPVCSTYSTSDETVEACNTSNANIDLAAGETIGTVGTATVGAFDFGLYDSKHQNFFVNPGRYSGLTRTAICPYDPFPTDQRSQLYARLMHGSISASGEAPLCGSMSVDVAGSARGVWVLQSNPVNQTGDETSFLVLAPHPMFPESRQTFSAGPSAIAASFGTPQLARYPLQISGRVNRLFRDVHADGLIYWYAYDVPARNLSYFVRLAQGEVLTIQKLTHVAGASPCNGDPATWSFGAAALSFIR